MNKEEKKWGVEYVYINEPEYCFKRLVVYPGHQSSLHYHKKKKETFIVECGTGTLEMVKRGEEKTYDLIPGTTITITAGTPHRFRNERHIELVIIEVSQHHDEDDVVRIEESS